jgi:cation transport ATPase
VVRSSKQNAIVYYSLVTKVFPLLLLVPLFLITSAWTKASTMDWLLDVGINLTVESIFYTVILAYTGIIFVIETMSNLPDGNKGNPIGLMGAGILGAIAIGCFIFAGSIFVGVYDPMSDSSEFNTVLSIIMIMAIILFVVQAREEMFHYRRFKMNILRF